MTCLHKLSHVQEVHEALAHVYVHVHVPGVHGTYMYMNVRKAHLPQPTPNLGETISVPTQAYLYKHAKWQSH